MSMIRKTADEHANGTSFLRRVVRRRTADEDVEHCELCYARLAPAHQHLLSCSDRQIVCACDACAMVFCEQKSEHYIRIPRRLLWLSDFRLADLEWESMMIPINLAFFYYDSSLRRMRAMYPSPAGAIDSLLSLETWTAIAGEHKALASMALDVEAFLVNRISPVAGYYIVSIDECYRLIGLIRLHWRGLCGGAEVWQQVNGFFASLRKRATEVLDYGEAEGTHA